MSTPTLKVPQMSAVKLALLARKIRSDMPDAAVLQSEPIAIVGHACRFPGGANSPGQYWELLKNGVDAISEVPEDRWDAQGLCDRDPAAPGKMTTHWGGFLTDVDQFDPTFFGIAPREAAAMDPQQRILLETAFEALDDAGFTQDVLAGSQTGVFVAIYNDDYALWRMSDLSQIDAYTALGTAHCVACGRLSFLLDLQGPSMVVDTGCSSSLVAVHLACQSLRSGESRIALAGAVNLVLSPEMTISLSKWGFMAADGRCKTFDAKADGFVRGEGCGVVVLKRLADALADGDRVLAVIRGTAVNEDGRSTVLTAPSGPAQQAVIRKALANGWVSAGEISYVEAHGTGTSLGDPIEVEALAEVVGRPADGEPCLIGSVKTNVGHLEAAAGMAGLIKTVLALQHEYIPKTLHFDSLNEHISLAGTRIQVASEGRAWTAGRGRRLAGVSSFGFGGTNAHVVLEEAPALPAAVVEAGCLALPISARNAESLRVLATKYVDLLRLEERPAALDICFTAAVRRTHHEYRAVVVGNSGDELADALAAFARGDSRWDLASGRRLVGRRNRPVFVFSGQGPQWWGMGRQLLATDPAYRAKLEAIAALMDPISGWSLLAELGADEAASRLTDTAIAQPAIFALQVALAAWLSSRGIEPSAAVGHSVGEIAAAHVAGALTLEQAVRLVVHRGRVMHRTAGLGRMVAASLTPDAAERMVAAYAGRLSLAAVNGPQSVVLAGTAEAVAASVHQLEAAGTAHRMLPVNYAFHSYQMQELVPELTQLIGGEKAQRTTIPFVSTVTGSLADEDTLDSGYWVRNVTEPVRFAAAIQWCERAGYDTFVEIGAHPVLAGSIAESFGDRVAEASIIATLHRGRLDAACLMATIGRLHASGQDVDWRRVYASGRTVSLPAYAWQRERFWLGRPEPAAAAPAVTHEGDSASLVGTRLRSSLFNDVVFERELSADSPRFVADHKIHGAVVFPATGYLAMAFAAAREAFRNPAVALRGVAFEEPLVLGEKPRRVQVILSQSGDAPTFRIASFIDEDDRWVEHAAGRVDMGCADPTPECPAVAPAGTSEITGHEHYERLAARGCNFGASFRHVQTITFAGHTSVAAVDAGRSNRATARLLDPGVLDSCLQALNAVLPEDGTYLPVAIDSIRLFGDGDGLIRAVATLDEHPSDEASRSARIVVAGDSDRVLIDIQGFRVRRVSSAAVLRLLRRVPEEWLYRVEWQPAGSPVASGRTPAESPVASSLDRTADRWVIIPDASGVAEGLVREIEATGHEAVVVPSRDERALADALKSGAPVAGVVHLESLDEAVRVEHTAAGVQEGAERSCRHALAAVQTMAACAPAVRLWLVTRGAQQTGYEGAAADPVQGTVWGFGRVAALEHPELSCTRVDLDPATGADAAAQLWHELRVASDEPEIALRIGTRLVPRLDRLPARTSQHRGAVTLEIAQRGSLDNLRYVAATRRAPGPGEVEILVRTTGLNFRDVLNVLGMYPGQAGAPGNEVAGTITAVGADVQDLRVGDHVAGTAQACFATYAIAAAVRVVKKPASLSFAEAATIPSAFLTAHYALDRIAQVRRGERVLIHAGAGGVGLAAVQLAGRAGAEVFATAGSHEKREYLRSLGVEHVMSSRTLDFADEIMASTGGRGVDVVLNSLAGEFIPRSLSTLAPNGRFVEIGRTDVWEAQRVAEFRSDVAYMALFLVDDLDRDPVSARQALSDLFDAVTRGELRALPARVFPAAATVDAFRFMAQARHIGKVVVAQDTPARTNGPGFTADGTYLITGAFGALGMEMARTIVEGGGRHLALVGRRPPSGDVAAQLATLRARGAHIHEWLADVSRPEFIETMRQALSGMPALRGIVHAAGTLDDGVLGEQTPDRFSAVLAPKVAGAWNLHHLTTGAALDFFVLFSGGASLFGSRGQGSYAAANAFLDSLTWHRQRHGLPALTINWGPWADAGMAASLSERDRRRLAERGVSTIPTEQGRQIFEHLAQNAVVAQIGVLPIDWAQFVPTMGSARPFFARLTVGRSETCAPASSVPASFAEAIAAASPGSRPKMLLAHISACVLRVLGLSPAYALDINQGLRDLGLDSLMAVELKNLLQASIGNPLAATLAFDHPTVVALAKHLGGLLEIVTEEPAPRDANVELERDFAGDISDLSDEEAEAQLSAELADLARTGIHVN